MSQEEKIIKVYLESKDKKDYMCFGFENVLSVCMTSDECQNDLQEVFLKLLSIIVDQPAKLEYEKNSKFNKGLYIDVCQEYVKDLNREVNSVRKKMPELLHL